MRVFAERRAHATADHKSDVYRTSFIFLIRTNEGAGSKQPLAWRAMRSNLQLQVRRGGAGLGFGAHRRPTMKDEVYPPCPALYIQKPAHRAPMAAQRLRGTFLSTWRAPVGSRTFHRG